MFAWDANVLIDSRLYNLPDEQAKEEIARGFAMRIFLPDGRWAIRLLPPQEQKQKIGFNNLVPFGRSYNPMLHPPALHYEIPHAGDCRSVSLRRFGLRRAIVDQKHVLTSRTRKVSATKIDFTTIQPSMKKSSILSSSLRASQPA